MEQSTTNLIGAVNRVLENIGERRVVALETPVARKAVVALSDALQDINSMADWTFTQEYIPAISWNMERADLGDTLRVHDVQYGSRDLGYRSLRFIDVRDFDYKPVEAGTPVYFTAETYNIIKVNPYPVDALEQAKYRFYVTRELTPPQTPTSFFPLPERHMQLLYFKAQSVLAQNHLDDANAMQMYEQQYRDLLQRMRDRERLTPSYGTNLFKQRGITRGRR